ncbi:MAG: DNA alkylation repair protein [Pseudomonadota bacterium]
MPNHIALTALARLPRKADGKASITALNRLVREFGPDHALAVMLWETGDGAARQLAVRITEPEKVNAALLERWVRGLADWDLTDAFAAHTVRHTALAVEKAREWAGRSAEFERRAGFATMAQLAWVKSDVDDAVFIDFLPLIEDAATDERYYVKKAVNWALRDIGKRNPALAAHATRTARRLQASDDHTARWVGRHRMREVFGG